MYCLVLNFTKSNFSELSASINTSNSIYIVESTLKPKYKINENDSLSASYWMWPNFVL